MQIVRLVWDSINVPHIAKHDVKPNEVEEACASDFMSFDGKKGRLILIAETKAGRTLAVILDPEPETGVYYPVTARLASRKERRLYQQHKGGEIAYDDVA